LKSVASADVGVLNVDELSNDVSSLATSNALVALTFLLAAALLIARWLHRSDRFEHRSPGLWFAGLASLALIIAVTLFRDGLPTTVRMGNAAEWSADGLRQLSRDPFGSSQFLLNIVLFVPAGAAWTLISRWPVKSWLALTGLSLIIESIQAVTGAGANDVADLAANSLGAAVGGAIVAALWAIGGNGNVDLSRRSRRLLLGGVTATALTLLAGWFIGASNRQQNVEDLLRSEFAGTDRTDLEALLQSDSSAVFGAGADLSDGTRYTDDTIEIRYPATFFGLHRCVFAIWNSERVEFRKESGHLCTDFIDG
jgi:hypothetical protein